MLVIGGYYTYQQLAINTVPTPHRAIALISLASIVIPLGTAGERGRRRHVFQSPGAVGLDRHRRRLLVQRCGVAGVLASASAVETQRPGDGHDRQRSDPRADSPRRSIGLPFLKRDSVTVSLVAGSGFALKFNGSPPIKRQSTRDMLTRDSCNESAYFQDCRSRAMRARHRPPERPRAARTGRTARRGIDDFGRLLEQPRRWTRGELDSADPD